jgi:photosystem II stability/assembly factor-like uncharacterized protein
MVVSKDNGNTWNLIKLYLTNESLNSIAYENNTFVVVGNEGNILVSNDGTKWNSIKPFQDSIFDSLYSIAYGDNAFVAVGDFGAIVVSHDNGDTWNFINPSPTNDRLYSITYGNNTFVAVGRNGTIVVGKSRN